MLHQGTFSICRLAVGHWKWSHHIGLCRQPVSGKHSFAQSRFTQSFAYSLPMASFCRLVISRYTQWMVTTPTLIYVVSKISDFTRTQVATVVLCQFSVILTGLLSSVAPSPWKCEALKHVHICCCFHSQNTALISSTQHSITLFIHVCMCSKAVT